MKIGKFKYRAATPRGYVCKHCGASGCKLWRDYQTFAVELACVMCARAQMKDAPDEATDHEGRTRDKHGQLCDQLGWMVPAVPTEDGKTFWGYTSVPHAGVHWWKGLPTYGMTKPQARAIIAIDELLTKSEPTSGLKVSDWLMTRGAGVIERGMIYTTLQGLEARGLLRSKEVRDPDAMRERGNRPRIVYTFPPGMAMHLLLQAQEMVRA